MQAIALLYHDVVWGDDLDASGFPGGAAALYKLDVRAFRRHMAAIAAVVPRPPDHIDNVYIHHRASGSGQNDVCIHHKASGAGQNDVCIHYPDRRLPVILTFDDGGASAHTAIADILDGHGFVGHFFVATDYIGRPGFMGAAEIRELARRGHVIGSHSCSHPLRMAACSPEILRTEWQVSCARLADILGAPVTCASLPGGHYSPRVAAAAASAGIRVLFTSEPRARAYRVRGVEVIGRFCIKRGAVAADARAFAAGELLPRAWATMSWSAKKIAKRVAGDAFVRLRERIYDRTLAAADPAPALQGRDEALSMSAEPAAAASLPKPTQSAAGDHPGHPRPKKPVEVIAG